MKRTVLSILCAILLIALLASCAGQPATLEATEAPPPAPAEPAEEASKPAEDPVKTGLSMIVSISKSRDATSEEDGLAQTNISLVAVTVDDTGVIRDCVIDTVQAKIGFSTEGLITTDLATEFPSKNELGEAYGLKAASSIGKEWNEQAAAMAEYAVGKTVEELKGIAVNDSGAPADADLASSVTLSIGGFLEGIEDAVLKAQHRGAAAGDELHLTTTTTMSKSKDATPEGDGQAQAYAVVAAFTTAGDTVTSCYIDAVQANVNFTAEGVITTDLASAPASKNELGYNYGMKNASSIGKEWHEQAAAFCEYATGKTVDEIASIAVNERTSPTEEDLASSVTIGIGDFQSLIAKAVS